MSKKDSSMLECVGKTTDGKELLAGVYRFYETTGLPLDVIFDLLRRKNSIVSWIHFYKEAHSAGMKHDRILSKLDESICDVWGKDFYDHVEDTLNLVFNDDPIHKERAKKMCQLEQMSTDDVKFEESIALVHAAKKAAPIKPDKIIMVNTPEKDISFPCVMCGANMNRPCQRIRHSKLGKLVVSDHDRLPPLTWNKPKSGVAKTQPMVAKTQPMKEVTEPMQAVTEPMQAFSNPFDPLSYPCMHCGVSENVFCDAKVASHPRLKPRDWKKKAFSPESLEEMRNNYKNTTTLYRPVGGLEHHLIRLSGNTKFPPRLEHQPIFYPVTSEEYAIKIAKEWNTKDKANGNIGIVVRFKIRTAYITMFDIQNVGGEAHQEYWIPASDMERFNKNIVGEIETIHIFRA